MLQLSRHLVMDEEALRFDGRVVIVTGGARGLGREYALAYARRGASVLVNDVDGQAAAELVRDMQGFGASALADSHSVVSEGESIVAAAVEAFGGVDIVIANAGVLRDRAFHRMSPDDWRVVLNVHLLGTFSVVRAAWPHMRARGFGRIVVTSSASGLYGQFGQANYAAAKMALVGLMRALAVEGERRNILCNALAPLAATRMLATSRDLARYADSLPPSRIVPVVLYLTHPTCFVTGAVCETAGGFVALLRLQRARGVFVAPAECTLAAVLALQAQVESGCSDFDCGEWDAPGGMDDALAPILRAYHASFQPDAAQLFVRPPAGLEPCCDAFARRTVLVTGAGRGLGACYARMFAAAGACVLVNDSDAGLAEAQAAAIRRAGGRAASHAGSVVTDAEAIVAACVEAFGGIDVLVANAGVLDDAPFARLERGAFEHVVAVSLDGSAAVARAAWPHMRAARYGRVLLCTSAAGLYGNAGQANYCAAKMGLVGLCKVLALEGAAYGIQVNALAPVAHSRLTAGVLPGALAEHVSVERVAPFVGLLCHEACSLTGGVFESGGGWLAAVRWQRSGSVVLQGAHQAEELRDRWAQVDDWSEDAVSVPSNALAAAAPMLAAAAAAANTPLHTSAL